MIGLPSRTVMRVHGYHVSILQDGVEVESHDVEDPLAFVESFKDRYKVADIPGPNRICRRRRPAIGAEYRHPCHADLGIHVACCWAVSA